MAVTRAQQLYSRAVHGEECVSKFSNSRAFNRAERLRALHGGHMRVAYGKKFIAKFSEGASADDTLMPFDIHRRDLGFRVALAARDDRAESRGICERPRRHRRGLCVCRQSKFGSV